MNFLSRLVVSSTLLIAVSQLSFAVQPAGQITSNPSRVNPTNPIERGGAINGVNLPKKTMVVDGVSYAFAATPVKIHPPAGNKQEKNFELKAGMQIRFTTSKVNWSAQEQVVEVWVTSRDGKPLR